MSPEQFSRFCKIVAEESITDLMQGGMSLEKATRIARDRALEKLREEEAAQATQENREAAG